MLHAIFPNFYLHPVILGGKCNVNVGKYAIHLGKLIHISLTWIKAIKGDDFPYSELFPVRENSEVVIIYSDV